MTYDDLKVCNCAQCEKELVGLEHQRYGPMFNLSPVRGRILGRPYCGSCLGLQVKIENLRQRMLQRTSSDPVV